MSCGSFLTRERSSDRPFGRRCERGGRENRGFVSDMVEFQMLRLWLGNKACRVRSPGPIQVESEWRCERYKRAQVRLNGMDRFAIGMSVSSLNRRRDISCLRCSHFMLEGRGNSYFAYRLPLNIYRWDPSSTPLLCQWLDERQLDYSKYHSCISWEVHIVN